MQLVLNFMIFASVINDVMRIRGAASTLLSILNRTPKIPPSGGRQLNAARGAVALADVSFRYPAKPEMEVLKQVSFEAEPGQVIALVGASGGGKSSIVALLERLYDPESGAVKFDGVDLR